MHSPRHLLPVLAALTIGCASDSTTTPARSPQSAQSSATHAELGQPIELKVGASVDVGASGLRLTFRAVEGDSRCPAGVTCVWAGDAEVALGLARAGRSATAALHTTAEPRVVEFDGYDIALLALAPEARSGRAIEPGEYVARVQVTKR